MADDQGISDAADLRRHISELIGVLADQNADRRLVEECLDHLHAMLETLGERPIAMMLRECVKEGGKATVGLELRRKSHSK